MPKLDVLNQINLEGFLDKFVIIPKILLPLIVVGGIVALAFWMFSYKDTIFILRPIFKQDKGRLIKKRSGETQYKLLKSMFLKKESLPPPDDDIALISPKGRKVFFAIKKGEGQYHFLKINKDLKNEDLIEVIPSDMYNWLIWRAKATREKMTTKPLWQQALMPVAVIVFVVMVSITFIYLFKTAPKSISVSVASGTQYIPALIPFIKRKWQ